MMDHHTHHGSMEQPHDVGVHGMLFFGDEALYLSHLPMFMSMHDHQVILEVTLAGDSGDAQAIYRADRRDTGERLYTLVPEKFSLQRLGAEGADALPSFKGTVHRGHFERPGNKAILKNITVSVANIIHFRQFDPHAEALPELQYLLFGESNELFMAHIITRPPDFDQVLRVSSINPAFPDEVLRRGVILAFAGRENRISDRIRAGERAIAQGNLTLEAATELYLEEGELAEEPTFNTTPEERAAGFV